MSQERADPVTIRRKLKTRTTGKQRTFLTRPIWGRAFLFALSLQADMKQERVTIGELPIKQPPNLFIFTLSECKVPLDIKAILAYTKY